MAGDWLKFEISTPDKPEVWEIASALNIDPDAVVGKLLRMWSWFDQHTEKGNAQSVTKNLLDRITGIMGFCDAVIDAGWMLEDENTIYLPNFDRHNGKTAKNRALTAKRVASYKENKCKSNDGSVTSSLPREEKRREENNTSLSLSKEVDMRFNFSSGEFENLDESQIEKWKEAYPAVDVLNEIKRAASWLIANPKNRKSNYQRFLNNWLIRSQDKAPRSYSNVGNQQTVIRAGCHKEFRPDF